VDKTISSNTSVLKEERKRPEERLSKPVQANTADRSKRTRTRRLALCSFVDTQRVL
jgi:hypothetical protein